ncbi:TOBE domain-containing protein, partial [Methylobacterium sp. WL6]|uniref:TOBE domain-containing protein n=4 Tax=unclassified Methylobacterium TaxID=2615210 RepID=UPI0011DA6279
LVPLLPRAIGSVVRVRVPARDVLIATAVPSGLSARNILSGRVAALIPAGNAVMVEVACGGAVLAARLTGAAVRDLDLAVGRPVHAVIKSVALDPAGMGGRRAIEI